MLQKSAETRPKSFHDKSKLFQRAGLSRMSKVTESLVVRGTLQYVSTEASYCFRRLARHVQTFDDGEISLKKANSHTHRATYQIHLGYCPLKWTNRTMLVQDEEQQIETNKTNKPTQNCTTQTRHVVFWDAMTNFIKSQTVMCSRRTLQGRV